MRKTKICAQEKLHTVKNILHGTESIRAAAQRLSVAPSAVRAWICSYKGNGIDAFSHTGNKHYSHECKVQAVTAYLNQEGSLFAICQRFGLRSSTQLRTWIKLYNSHEELKASGTGGFSIMTKGRKTTFDERVEMVQYCIAHDHNYAETAVKYGISYQQARSYTLKYEAGGLDALQDNRGKRKTED
ncbi:helix-turn-helix domain-containing protein, partial [Megasphaera sp. DISK 18]|uniref:helix-turn-helix domain-containing protein n=1 Tax=Megasphaera sp. DISK 18 TaxID=1776081 RepID=UPI0008070BC2